jgi:DNA polymerase-3 subunit alpha
VEFVFGACGLRGQRALDKRVPAIVDRWDRAGVDVLLGRLLQGDGCVDVKGRTVFYATSSPGLAQDVRRLFLKLGIGSTVHTKRFAYRGGVRTGYTVNVTGGRDAFARLAASVGPHLIGAKRAALALLAATRPGAVLLARGTVEVIPWALCREPVRDAMAKHFPSLRDGCRALGIAYRSMFDDAARGGLRRDTVAHLADRLDAPALHAIADAPIAWSRPRGFTVAGEEATYDIEVPGAASFVADGIVVHNSHAAAYGLVAYQTAYCKANYPVAFMAALLTSEMGDTDKIVKYIEECRAMGIEVKPPDVNVSAVQFSVAGGAIRFGLAAIKNVGAAAMESILATRGQAGPFPSLEDFCARVDLRLVNRRVVESLVKAGAFDSLRLPRAHLMATVEAALESGQRQQRDRADGQASFFDLMPAPPAPAAVAASPSVAGEWDDDQRLEFEKEVLGFYISGHPLARFQPVVESLGITPTTEVAAKGTGARVLLFGQVAALKETATKSGNRMAFLTLEDMVGTTEVTVFPEPFRAAADHLRRRQPLLVRGRVDDSDKGRVVLADEIRPFEHALVDAPAPAADPGRGEAHAVRVRVPVADDPGAALETLRQACALHPGRVPVFVHVLLPAHEVVVRARAVSVSAGPPLLEALERLLGPGAVAIDHA